MSDDKMTIRFSSFLHGLNTGGQLMNFVTIHPHVIYSSQSSKYLLLRFLFVCLFCFFRAVSMSCGVSQAWSWIGVVACSCRPMPQPQQNQILNPLCKAGDWTCILMDASQVLNPLSHNGNSFCSVVVGFFLLLFFLFSLFKGWMCSTWKFPG